MNETQKIPWKRISVEAAAIVASILLAFAIQAWWEEQQEKRDEKTYLTSLRQELIRGLDGVAEREGVHKEVLDANVALINQIQDESRASVESLHYMFSLLSRPTDLRLPRAVFDDLVSSGGTQLIRSDDLRIALALYGRRLGLFQADNDQHEQWQGKQWVNNGNGIPGDALGAEGPQQLGAIACAGIQQAVGGIT